MRRARSLLLPSLAIALGAAWAVVRPSPACADEPPAAAPGGTAGPAAVERLTAEELEILRRRFPDWDQREAAERERIASNVMRLRLLSPDDRRRLLERVKRLELAGPDAAEKLRGWHEMSHAEQERMREKRVFFRGMGAQVVGALPPDARQLVTPGALHVSLTFSERLRLEVGISALLRKKIVQAWVASPPLDAEASPGAPPAQVQRLVAARDAVRAAGPLGPEDDRRKFAIALVEDRLLALRRRLQGETLDEPGRGARFGAMAKEAFPEAFAAVVADVARLASRGRDGLRPLLADGAEGERLSPEKRPLAELVIRLELARPVFAALSPELAAKAQAFQGDLLVALGWNAEALRSLAESKNEVERLTKLAVYRRWFGGGSGLTPWGNGRRPGPGPGGVPPGPRRPGRGGVPPTPPAMGGAPGGDEPPAMGG